nr:immunoglobulin light chain junction region [Macaca mulatta]MOX78082.1 immunoglobulin light chain junction region [Macaca mulatta]MOX78123.1 immunoglobulin light chain junction region [Macaca mulatta]MOX78532.1 immunoglobulin light chain junction region [Macaca mulatta]MOX78627.1 immunoglobulin light chain junction region [Macaca mulatta]
DYYCAMWHSSASGFF